MITNTSKGINLAKKSVILTSILGKAIGMMFSRSDKGYVFVFNKLKTVDFHTFFVFFPIDILFLDENKKVLDIKRNVKPFTINVRSKAKYVIELPANSIDNTRIKDTISFK